jgi:hypothetical protein
MSEAELHILRGRLDGGIRNKAARGELRRALPVGLVWGEKEGEIHFHPDEAVTGAIRTIFPELNTHPAYPLSTLRCVPRDTQRKTRGRADRYSFLVRNFHPLLHAGLARRTVMPWLRQFHPRALPRRVFRFAGRWKA